MTTHLAGLHVVIGHRSIQRCAICGKALFNDDLSRMAYPDGQDRMPAHWKVGNLVEVGDGFSRDTGPLEPEFRVADLPTSLCLELVEE